MLVFIVFIEIMEVMHVCLSSQDVLLHWRDAISRFLQDGKKWVEGGRIMGVRGLGYSGVWRGGSNVFFSLDFDSGGIGHGL